jgi:glutamate-5-semialdehyde dehydrogenase
MSLKTQMIKLAENSKKASREAELLKTPKKNRILREIAAQLIKNKTYLIQENKKDMKYADKAGLSAAMKDRLLLTEARVRSMAHAVRDVSKLKDPTGEIIKKWKRPNGLELSQVRVPLGVVLVIYESRPNVTSECASLCFKSGNAVILRGGKEAFYSNRAISSIYQKVLKRHDIPANVVSFVDNIDRESVFQLLQLTDLIDLAIPRGGESLIRHVTEISKIPLVKHYKGVCHVYVDKDADLKMAHKIALNAKCQRPSVCNAMETLLVHEKIAKRFLPSLLEALEKAGCEVRLCGKTRLLLKKQHAKKATQKDWETEYLDLILSIRTVKNVDEAIKHIEQFGSRHTESIITRNKIAAETFVRRVDASSVMVNASTRFSDGNEYGFGAEIGISTDKLHARGPMGLEGLTTYKYVVRGRGQIRE